MDAVQGKRVKIIDRKTHKLGKTLAEAVDPHRGVIARFADEARPFLSRRLTELWARVFPMVLPPQDEDGLAVIVLNSNADTHFSFTNALGMIPGRADERHRVCDRATSARSVGDCAASPRCRVSVEGEDVV